MYFSDKIQIYSIGIDIENKHTHFINLNLASYSEIFGASELFGALDKLPAPDIILASPPCESWSIASAMDGGNVCWYAQDINTLFGIVEADNPFTIRTKEQIDRRNQEIPHFQKHWWKTVFNRINGELCAFNTMRIIERYAPVIWIIENPQSSKIWRYYGEIQGFRGMKNLAHYNAYDNAFPHKPTIFYSNTCFPLKRTREKAKVVLSAKGVNDSRPIISGYNARSNIPLELIRDILAHCITKLKTHKERT